jgi:GT2 family glycosyltransferase
MSRAVDERVEQTTGARQRTGYVHTIIISNGRRDDTLACLAALQAAAVPGMRITVLDNASSDGTVEAIRTHFADVEVIVLPENRGYAGNNNLGMAMALEQGARWVFLLNDDADVAADCVQRMVTLGETEPRIAAVGSLVLHHDEPEVIQSAGGCIDTRLRPTHMLPNEPMSAAPRAPYEVDWASGCALLVRTAALREVGLLDERYFLYWEETEWCMRARAGGWRILVEPGARTWHKGVQRNYRPAPYVAYYYTRNRLLTLSKHRAPVQAWLVAYSEILRTLTSYSVRPRWRPQRAHRDAIWAGLVDYHRGHFGKRQTASVKGLGQG